MPGVWCKANTKMTSKKASGCWRNCYLKDAKRSNEMMSSKALKYVRRLLQTEPQNNQAKELESLIDKAMKKDGLVGMSIVGGIILGVTRLVGLIRLDVAKSKS
uniref:Uncharacterized protein n=1 Tax=Vombatus ursinus TaxID=29139 RepID=A0A4X2L7L6_VOMUR